MNAEFCLEKLKIMAKSDRNLCGRLLDTVNKENPLKELCLIAAERGLQLYEMDIISIGEDYYANMRRSTNGGGENSPLLSGSDDYYDMFIAELKAMC